MRTLVLFSALLFSGVFYAQKPSKPIGMFVMKGANCAGFRFDSEVKGAFVNEMGCSPSELRIKWIDDKHFFTVQATPHQKNCPPGVSVYEVLSFDGKTLKLKEFWAGWGEQKEEVTTYVKN